MNLYVVSEILNYKILNDIDFDPSIFAREGAPSNFGIKVCDKTGTQVGIAFQMPVKEEGVINFDLDYKPCLDVIKKYYDLQGLYNFGVWLGHFSFVAGNHEAVVTRCKFEPEFTDSY
mgnify:FL=1|jgi:hypothetical protein